MWRLLLVGLTACGRVGFPELADGAAHDASPDAKPVEIVAIAAAGVWAPASELRRVLATSTSTTTFTLASWYKSSVAGGMPFCAGTTPSDHSFVWADDVPVAGHLVFQHHTGAVSPEVGAGWPYNDRWMHIVVAVDTNQLDDLQRVRWWIDGEPVPPRVTAPGVPQGTSLHLGAASVVHTVGNKWDGAFNWTGSLAETYIIWGHALDASEFVTMVAPGAARSIRYAGPIEAESVHFDYAGATGGENAFIGQPDWTATAMSTTTVDLPY